MKKTFLKRLEQSNLFFFHTKHLQDCNTSMDELFMNDTKKNPLGFRNPLFRETVVIRALATIREINDELLGLIDAQNSQIVESNLTTAMKNLIDLKINEITDELTLDRLNR